MVDVLHYAEKVFNNRPADVSLVNSRDPLMVGEEKDLIGFRFFDVVQNFRGQEEITNYSGMYYFGSRISYKDLVLEQDDFIKRMQLDYLSRLGIEEAIFCEKAGKVISTISVSDKTIEEVRLERINEQVRNIDVNQKEFLNTLITTLEEHGNDVDIITSEVLEFLCDLEIDPEIDAIEAIIRTYDLYVNGYKAASTSAVVGDLKIGSYERETYFKLSDSVDMVSPLYQEYPYLEKMMDKVKLAISDEDSLAESVQAKTKSKRNK